MGIFIALLIIAGVSLWYVKGKGEGWAGLLTLIMPKQLTNEQLRERDKELQKKAAELEERKLLKQRINQSRERIKKAKEL